MAFVHQVLLSDVFVVFFQNQRFRAPPKVTPLRNKNRRVLLKSDDSDPPTLRCTHQDASRKSVELRGSRSVRGSNGFARAVSGNKQNKKRGKLPE